MSINWRIASLVCVIALSVMSMRPVKSLDKTAPIAENLGGLVGGKGELLLPRDFALRWSHLGSVFVNDEFHNTYIKPDDLAYYRANSKFKDKTVLVKEIRSSNSGRLTTGDAHWGSGVKIWFVMMKDEKGRFKDNPLWGNGWAWALYKGDAPDKQVATDYKKDCLSCHVPAQKTDWVYIDKYPALTAEAPVPVGNSSKAPVSGNSSEAPDTGRGKSLFATSCQGCHSDQKGENGVGPTLFGVYERKSGSVAGYDYSDAMKAASVVWEDVALNKHLASPKGFIPGNYMGDSFPSGVASQSDRSALIDYLKTLK